MNKLGIILFNLLCLNLISCVEVRDPAKEGQAAPVEISDAQPTENQAAVLPDLVIDQDMYVYQGEIMNKEQVDLRQYQDAKRGSQVVGLGEVVSAKPLEFHYDKVRFGPQGVLHVHGDTIKIYANYLESMHGKIMTFAEGRKAKMNLAGISGGFVSIRAKDASGILKFEMRGEHGGDGSNGRNGQRHDEGRGNICDGEPWKFDAGPGLNGQKGGDSGIARVTIDSSAVNFEVLIDSYEGQGGLGGKAGTPTSCVNPWHEGLPAPDGVNGARGMQKKADSFFKSKP